MASGGQWLGIGWAPSRGGGGGNVPKCASNNTAASRRDGGGFGTCDTWNGQIWSAEDWAPLLRKPAENGFDTKSPDLWVQTVNSGRSLRWAFGGCCYGLGATGSTYINAPPARARTDTRKHGDGPDNTAAPAGGCVRARALPHPPDPLQEPTIPRRCARSVGHTSSPAQVRGRGDWGGGGQCLFDVP